MIDDKSVWQLSCRLGLSKPDKSVRGWNFSRVELQRTGDKDAHQDRNGNYEG